MIEDEKYLFRCLELASKQRRLAFPNPSVGAIIVHNNRIIGEGATSPYGGAHAEVNALKSVKNKELLSEATLYVTLEPCAHYGKTPPCSLAIIEHKIPRVVIGSTDPFEAVNGKGIALLREAGVDLKIGVLKKECDDSHREFFLFHQQQRPYITLKWAQSKDGFIDRHRTTEKKGINWITQPATQALTHQWRHEHMGIAVGTNTAIVDQPSLTTRAFKGQNPTRIVLDRNLQLLSNHPLLSDESTTLILNEHKEQKKGTNHFIAVDFSKIPNEICRIAYEHRLLSVMIEGGAQLLRSFIDQNLWDEARILTGDIEFTDGLPAPKLDGLTTDRFWFGEDHVQIIRHV